MSLTLNDIKHKLRLLDEITLMEVLEISSEELVDLDLEGVELLNGLLEDVADHQLGAVISVQLVGGVVEGSKDIGLSISLSAIWKQLFTKKCALI